MDLSWRGEMLRVQDMSIQVAFAYQWPIDRLIHLYKYQTRLELLPIFQYGLMQLQRPNADALLAVPVSPTRLQERGFNQSHELAKQMADHWDIPLLTGVNRRDGLRQKGLSRGERLQNLDDAFVLDGCMPPLPRRIALIAEFGGLFACSRRRRGVRVGCCEPTSVPFKSITDFVG